MISYGNPNWMRNLFLLTDSHPATSCYVNMLSESYSNILFNLRFVNCSNKCSESLPAGIKTERSGDSAESCRDMESKPFIARCYLLEHCVSGRSAGEGIGYPLQYSWASLVAQTVRNLSAYNAGDLQIPGSGRSPGGGHGNPTPVF